MKTLNTAIVTALLAMGLAGNAMAAPGHQSSDRDNKIVMKVTTHKAAPSHHIAKKVVKKVTPQRSAHKTVVKRAPAKKVVKRVVSKQHNKKVAKRVYRVRPGDTLYSIGKRNHVSVNQLVKINKLWGNKANNLRVGMVLRLA